ncbi:lysine N(6)-hydroxylase/L-ornithine N(5)-oxygenase family protein [Actibacterium sp. 188UL27-1]|uniref:lysine N(6)-hydroxylase/L-ornithine N(5)-oxygenase family protein n=1 Tax=Actibacterium sp. 188UL27-1 TaxID=2786961 RepID=UPI001959B17E|nr:SidA/IucD/PvdA family monooxygenase [Actibacterium sp. 188UL27-1]MBM7069736.1 SidA/IucD/PvdA family monooxygenase [Actibacterium sp. 188UL27-1]
MTLDLAGIGIGPFNLSLAALADNVTGLDVAFFDRKPNFTWHPGLAFEDSEMQTSYLKDMVTPVQPTSSWSFLNYLVVQGRFYDFMAARFDTVSRREFTDYMAWVAESLGTCTFATSIQEVDHDGNRFTLKTDSGQTIRATSIAVGTGPVPRIPADAPLGQNCYHGIEYLNRKADMRGKRVVVVGGGQTGAEIVLDLLSEHPGPDELTWLSRRDAFWHLQEGSLVDQIFTPAYQRAYRQLPAEIQQHALANQKYSSDGLTPATADQVYRALYRQRYVNGHGQTSLRPGREVTHITPRYGAFELTATATDGQTEGLTADVVILATGFETTLPDCLSPLASRIDLQPGGALQLGDAYRVQWDGPDDAPIYGLNHGRQSHGIVDPQLSLTAWRSAVILEDLTNRHLFAALRGNQVGLVDWETMSGPVDIRISA